MPLEIGTNDSRCKACGKLPLARLARIDPELLGPVRHRSAQAQIHLTVIRARAELVRARTALVNAARGLVKSYGQRLPKCGTQQELCGDTSHIDNFNDVFGNLYCDVFEVLPRE